MPLLTRNGHGWGQEPLSLQPLRPSSAAWGVARARRRPDLMPIRQFLDGERFEARTLRASGILPTKPSATGFDDYAKNMCDLLQVNLGSFWHFYDRVQSFLLSSPAERTQSETEQKRADVARARRRWIREQGMLDPARLVFIDETAISTNMVRLRGRWSRGGAAGRIGRRRCLRAHRAAGRRGAKREDAYFRVTLAT